MPARRRRALGNICFYGFVCCGLLSIGLALVVPAMLASSGSRVHSGAGSLKQFASIETTFKTSDSDGNGVYDYWVGDVAGLYYLTHSSSQQLRMIEISVALADANPKPTGRWTASLPLVTRPKAGYWFKALPVEGAVDGRHPDRFAFAAYPDKYGEKHILTFILNQDGDMWLKDLGGRVIGAWPKDPSAEGWTKMD